MHSIILKREDLYREVWTRPVVQVAKEYGISDVGLAKACRRMGVPRPPIGYWAKRDAGQEMKIPPLPPLSGDMRPAVEVRVPKTVPSVELLPEPDISVPVRLRSPHPLVKLTRAELRGAGTDEYGRVSPRGAKGLEVRVSPAQLTRALRVAEGLIRGLESLGYAVELRNRWNQKFETCALIDGEEVRFSIWEPSRRSVLPADGSRWSYDRYVYAPTGDLELRIDEYVSVATSKTIRDRPSGNLVEESLGRFVVSMNAVAQVKNAGRKIREADGRRREAALLERRQAEREAAYQDWLRCELFRQSKAYEQAVSVRTLLDAIQSRAGDKLTTKQQRWVEWAQREADRIDPVASEKDFANSLEPPDSWEPVQNSKLGR